MDALGDRMKAYENAEAGRRFMRLLPVVARLDGKTFSRFTKSLKRPYDERLSRLMVDTTVYLVTQTGANIGYTQSDEISLVWYSDNGKSQIFLDGRIQKMVSILGSLCTAYFNAHLGKKIPEKDGALAFFDARVWAMPTLAEAANVFLWRELDASKNSVSMAAQDLYSHRQLHGMSTARQQDMLMAKGVNWNDYPAFFKRGTFVQRKKSLRRYTAAEIGELPPKHRARSNPDLMVERTDVRVLDMPPFSKVNNRVQVIFEGAEPEIAAEAGRETPPAD